MLHGPDVPRVGPAACLVASGRLRQDRFASRVKPEPRALATGISRSKTVSLTEVLSLEGLDGCSVCFP